MLAGCSPSDDDQPTEQPGTGATTVRGTAPATAPPTITRQDTTSTSSIVVMDAAQPGDTADSLASVTRCDDDDPAQPIAELTWAPASSPGRAQRVQVSIDPRGFGDSTVIGPELPGDATSARWTEISGQALHQWRVLTERDGAWVSSRPASFEGPTCAVDYQPDS